MAEGLDGRGRRLFDEADSKHESTFRRLGNDIALEAIDAERGRRNMHEQIRQALDLAAEDGQKMATFHFEVLVRAAELGAADATEFCRAVGVPESYRTEFRKMLALAAIIRERGLSLG